MVNWLAFGVSVIALITSFVAIGMSKKVNDINLNSEHLKDIYKEFLTNRIPEGRRFLRFNIEGVLTDVDNLHGTLVDLRKSLLYYKYLDEYFYNSLCEEIQGLEDYIVENDGAIFTETEQKNANSFIEEKLENIYSLINNKYKNG